ncbi:RNase adapter RapZ [Acidimicrobiaceae bacterium USS-CC1]|uniref:RNase adapter RapZ n=1 Tax=Acidiferrimicrobium australe TaxID=2664430 RepID=A0ABW9QVK5_9ACTN|nr:RNase adapter RapZ [Acidiferrimicrobium australe]
MVDYLIITGLSGAGRSQAAATLEDLGWFVIDNMPTALIAKVAELTSGPGARTQRVALVVGRDATQLEELQSAVRQLRLEGARVRVLYLEASDEVLVRRFEGTRRRHPVGREGVTDAIRIERERLRPIRELADIVVDTSETNVNQLRERLVELFADTAAQTMRVTVLSFGFKHGVPRDVDTLFDARFLPNPYWIDELRPFTGLDRPVRDWVLEQPPAEEFLDRVDDLLGFLLPAYVKEAKAYLTIAVGCTGGRHRSVALVEALAARIRARGYEPAVHHRDVQR